VDAADKKRILYELGDIPESVYDELVVILIDETLKQVVKINEAINGSRPDEILRIVHSIKGSAGNLRIARIQEAAKAIETEIKEMLKSEGGMRDTLKFAGLLEDMKAAAEKERKERA